MKKYIFSVLMAAMAVFTFSSCEDVPAPYGTPNQPSTPDTPEVSTDGTEANPYTVTDAKTVGSGTNVFVKGYIVGFIPDKSLSEAVFSAKNAVNLNVIIAASADETDVNKCMPVQLPAGDIRTAVNLKDNTANLGQEVLLCGNLESYFGAIGVKSTSYAKIGSKEVGKKPGSTTPETPSTGKGSASEPYTIAEAITAIKAGAPSYEVYVKGTISKVTYYNATYKSLSYNLVDAGATDVLEVFSGKGLNGADFAAKEDLKVGQVVVVKGIIKAFTKNESTIYEIDKNSTIISIEGEGTVTPTPDPTPDAGTSGTLSIDGLNVTLTNSAATAGENVKVEDISTLNPEAKIESIKLEDGTTITFDINSSKTAPAYNANYKEIRIYANNKMTITASKSIAKIVLTCSHDNTKGDCVGNETATVTFSANTATYTNVFTGTSGGGTQLRIKAIEIIYAK